MSVRQRVDRRMTHIFGPQYTIHEIEGGYTINGRGPVVGTLRAHSTDELVRKLRAWDRKQNGRIPLSRVYGDIPVLARAKELSRA